MDVNSQRKNYKDDGQGGLEKMVKIALQPVSPSHVPYKRI